MSESDSNDKDSAQRSTFGSARTSSVTRYMSLGGKNVSNKIFGRSYDFRDNSKEGNGCVRVGYTALYPGARLPTLKITSETCRLSSQLLLILCDLYIDLFKYVN
jgi:hypothetical protein